MHRAGAGAVQKRCDVTVRVGAETGHSACGRFPPGSDFVSPLQGRWGGRRAGPAALPGQLRVPGGGGVGRALEVRPDPPRFPRRPPPAAHRGGHVLAARPRGFLAREATSIEAFRTTQRQASPRNARAGRWRARPITSPSRTMRRQSRAAKGSGRTRRYGWPRRCLGASGRCASSPTRWCGRGADGGVVLAVACGQGRALRVCARWEGAERAIRAVCSNSPDAPARTTKKPWSVDSQGLFLVCRTLADRLNRCDGGEEEDRTPDLRIANATLSQLSYPPDTTEKL